MAITAQFAAIPGVEVSGITQGNTFRDGGGLTFTLVCAGPSTASGAGVGKRINRVMIHAVATTTAGMVRFFINDLSSTKRLILEKSIPAITPSAINMAFRTEVPELVGLILPGTVGGTASSLYASSNNTESFNIICESGTL